MSQTFFSDESKPETIQFAIFVKLASHYTTFANYIPLELVLRDFHFLLTDHLYVVY